MASLKSAMALLYSFLLARLAPRPMNASADLGSSLIASSKSAMALSYFLLRVPDQASAAVISRIPGIEPDRLVVVAQGLVIVLVCPPEQRPGRRGKTRLSGWAWICWVKNSRACSSEHDLVGRGPAAWPSRFAL